MERVSWDSLQKDVAACTRCDLCKTRTHTAFGEGDLHAKMLFVGEGPGREEDLQGRPFVGPAGQLLDRMLAAIDIRREDVYIANIVKCRPPGNRNPLPEEAASCLPYLRGQYALLRPKILVCLGSVALRYVMDPAARITKCRGEWREKGGVWMIATYHPAALLRNEALKRDAWQDMQAIREKYQEIMQGG